MIMHTHNPVYVPTTDGSPWRRAGYQISEWVLAVLGAIGAFVGTFILVGPEDQWVGLGGQTSWRVGDIAAGWGYGLLVAGVVALAGAAALVARGRRHPAKLSGIERSGWADVLVHAVAFLLVNAFVWAQDIALGDGINYAVWMTVPWAIGLAAHAGATAVAGRKR